MRKSGILLPLFSLRGKFGIGTMGEEAREWIDFLQQSGVREWQMLPIGPVGYADSPYQPFSTFAGNPLFLDFTQLSKQDLLTEDEVETAIRDTDTVDYSEQTTLCYSLLRKAFSRFLPDDGFVRFCEEETWLHDYATFMAIKESYGMTGMDAWDWSLRLREPDAIQDFCIEHQAEIAFWKFVQYQFFLQWHELKAYANAHDVELIGDLPIYVAYDSADVWSQPEAFQLDEDRCVTAVAGCPPDYFSKDGQRWGNPLYNWHAMKTDGYGWWNHRLLHAAKLFDSVRIDHFRAFSEYWSIPAQDTTARNGHWEPGPGLELFQQTKKAVESVNIIAEDLGIISDNVYTLLSQTGFPGMNVLQFAFAKGLESQYLPFHHKVNSITYTGTHDNDTLVGWLTQLDEETRQYVQRFTHTDNILSCAKAIVDLAWMSNADTCIVPLQDLLLLDSSARINTPSVTGGNWCWRVPKGALSPELIQDLRERKDVFFR